MKSYDLVIIGAGPAGLSAAIYAVRYKMKVLVIGKLPGGTATKAYHVWNFPSRKKILGVELMMKILDQVKELGVEIIPYNARDIKKKKDVFEIHTRVGNYTAKKIILATGTERRKLGLENEDELVGKGVNYCGTCDAPLYKNKIVAVVGGCNAALSTAQLLTNFAEKVYLISRGKDFCDAGKVDAEIVNNNKKIKIMLKTEIVKLIGKEKLEELELSSKEKLKVDGLFIEIGSVPSVILADQIGVRVKNNEIVVDKNQKTNVFGVFAAGDVTDTPLKQIIVACGDGAKAAYGVYKELGLGLNL